MAPKRGHSMMMNVVKLISTWLAKLLAEGSRISKWYSDVRVKNTKKRRLRRLLTDSRYEWREFETLQNAIRENAETTRDLLFEIGARPSIREKNVWTIDKQK